MTNLIWPAEQNTQAYIKLSLGSFCTAELKAVSETCIEIYRMQNVGVACLFQFSIKCHNFNEDVQPKSVWDRTTSETKRKQEITGKRFTCVSLRKA